MDIFNLPNILTLFRILLIPVFTAFFLGGDYRTALIIFGITGLTDLVDGTLARLLKKKTTLGAILDPVADKLLMLVTFIVIAVAKLVPAWLAVLVILRDVWIVTGVFILKKLKRKLYFKPTALSKLNTLCQLVTIFLAFLLTFLRSEQPDWLDLYGDKASLTLKIMVYLTGAMTVLTGIQYTRIGMMILKGRREYADLPLKEVQVDRQ